jgi:SAM-dependent methyltransferase
MPLIASLIDRMWRLIPSGVRRLIPMESRLRRVGRRLRAPALPHDAIYTALYFAELDVTASSSAPAIATSIARRFEPRSVIDVGCGTGALLAALKQLGVATLGLEHAEAARVVCRQRGLDVRDFDLEGDTDAAGDRFDLAVCLEVAEHLPARAGDRLVALLCRIAGTVLFTAATPGQGGTDHVNERPHAYWVARFRRHGFTLDEGPTRAIRAEWRAAGTADWYSCNALVFRYFAE